MARYNLALASIAIFSCTARAEQIVCPPMPKDGTTITTDYNADVKGAVGTLGPIKAGELSGKIQTTANNLFSKYPNIDRIVTLQTMAATYCTMLLGSGLSPVDKLNRWERFQERVLALPATTMSPAPSAATQERSDLIDEQTRIQAAADRTTKRIGSLQETLVKIVERVQNRRAVALVEDFERSPTDDEKYDRQVVLGRLESDRREVERDISSQREVLAGLQDRSRQISRRLVSLAP